MLYELLFSLQAMIKLALGEIQNLKPKQNLYSYIKYFELAAGKKVERVDNWQDILNEEDAVFADISVKPGEIIEEITESKRRAGFVIVKGINRGEVLDRADLLSAIIKEKIILN